MKERSRTHRETFSWASAHDHSSPHTLYSMLTVTPKLLPFLLFLLFLLLSSVILFQFLWLSSFPCLTSHTRYWFMVMTKWKSSYIGYAVLYIIKEWPFNSTDYDLYFLLLSCNYLKTGSIIRYRHICECSAFCHCLFLLLREIYLICEKEKTLILFYDVVWHLGEKKKISTCTKQ